MTKTINEEKQWDQKKNSTNNYSSIKVFGKEGESNSHITDHWKEVKNFKYE